MDASLNDAHLAEAIARQGGYEEVELKSLWGAVAGALGKKKSHANMIKQRYEDMLRASVEQDEQDEEEAQDYEVDQILDKRTHQGQLEYLVKWKGADANEDDTSWEPRRNLAGCDEALHEFETRQPRSREREAREQPAAAAATAPAASAMSVSDAQPPEATGSAVAASHVAADGREYRRVTGVMRPQHGQLGHQGWIVELGEGQVRRTPAPQLPAVPCMVACHPPASRASRARAAGGARRQRHAEATGAAAAARLLREPAAIRIAETTPASGVRCVQGGARRAERCKLDHCGWPVPVWTDGMLLKSGLFRMNQRHLQSRHTPTSHHTPLSCPLAAGVFAAAALRRRVGKSGEGKQDEQRYTVTTVYTTRIVTARAWCTRLISAERRDEIANICDLARIWPLGH